MISTTSKLQVVFYSIFLAVMSEILINAITVGINGN